MSFKFNFTPGALAQLIPGNSRVDYWHTALCEILPKYHITSLTRVAHFVSQCAHESNNFRSLEENLNYSQRALTTVFSRYFGPGKENAAEYARRPEKIANYVYMDRYRSSKLGNIHSGDGWRFRGRGLKQLTGRDNYSAFGLSIGLTAEQAADYVSTEKGAVESACWYWHNRNLNKIADTNDVVGITRAINGGTIGLEDRQRRYNHAINVLAAELPAGIEFTLLQNGSRGAEVKVLQHALGITADGIFGPGTEQALVKWQLNNRLTADGIAGASTLRALLG